MKLLKASIATFALVAFSQAAYSQTTTVRITGSSAFRAATHNAILNIMNLTGTGDGYAFSGSSLSGATNGIFKGTVAGVTGKVIVKTTWSGSVAGVRDVVQNNNVNFLLDTTTISAAGTSGATTVGDNAVPDIAMSDTFQSSTKYTNPVLTRSIVGVIPFAWVASKDSPAGLTNLTPQLARSLFKSGFASAALFTNNDADASDKVGGTTVYAIGRDPFSGTRLTAFAESGVGVNTVVAQYEPGPTAPASNTVSQIRFTLPNATDGVVAGDNGFSSGGTLADQLRYTTTSVEDTNNNLTGLKICFVSYLGESDASRAVNGTGSAVTGTNAGNARYLSYNGVTAFGGVSTSFANVTVATGSNVVTLPAGSTTGLVVGQFVRFSGTNSGFVPGGTTITSIPSGTTFTISSNATGTGAVATATTSNLLPTPIRNGSYTFWGYEQIMWRSSFTGDQLTVGTALRNQIKNTDYFASGLDDASMRVSRSTDGGTVTQKY